MTTPRLLALGLTAGAALLLSPAAGLANEPAAGGEPSIFDLPARWDLSLYTLIVFGLLFFILSYFAWPPIMAGMKAREDAITGARDEALAARAAAEAARAELAAKLAAAQGEIRAMLDEARKDADALRTTEREAGVKEAAAERDRAKREIEAAKDQALSEIYTKSVDLAALMSSKALRREMTAADHARLLDESLAEIAAKVSAN